MSPATEERLIMRAILHSAYDKLEATPARRTASRVRTLREIKELEREIEAMDRGRA
jgi:hypothetical protein